MDITFIHISRHDKPKHFTCLPACSSESVESPILLPSYDIFLRYHDILPFSTLLFSLSFFFFFSRINLYHPAQRREALRAVQSKRGASYYRRKLEDRDDSPWNCGRVLKIGRIGDSVARNTEVPLRYKYFFNSSTILFPKITDLSITVSDIVTIIISLFQI